MVEIKEVASDPAPADGDAAGLRQRQGQGQSKGSGPSGATVDLSNGSGHLLKQITKEGEGEVCGSPKAVAVHYTGRFPDGGQVFDSSVARGQPLRFVVGQRRVILGWDIGIASMKVGEKAILTCGPDFAYGSTGAGGGAIPPNATLEFEVELLEMGEGAAEPGSFTTIFALVAMALLAYLYSTGALASLTSKL